MYGVGEEATDGFARRCLLARRLVERGVRFVQLYAGTWDSHDYIHRAHTSLIRAVDRPIAALIQDLKQRGLLDETLVVWCGEFGRSPDNGVRGGVAYGRDHNAKAMTIWLSGGGVNAGPDDRRHRRARRRSSRSRPPDPRPARHAFETPRPGRQPPHLLPRRPLQTALAVRREGD
jgi:hypothetical protein